MLEKTIAYHCAPALAGIRPANMAQKMLRSQVGTQTFLRLKFYAFCMRSTKSGPYGFVVLLG